MNQTTQVTNETAADFLPTCEQCGSSTRLVGIEAHQRMKKMDLHTFACDRCNLTMAIVMPVPKPDTDALAPKCGRQHSKAG